MIVDPLIYTKVGVSDRQSPCDTHITYIREDFLCVGRYA